ncbi:hypothetical protein JXO52_05770 [bacterium]|nr:hypothetical protein [bacterium]
MVSPVYLLVVTIAAVFLVPLADRIGRSYGMSVFYAAIAAAAGLGLFWFLSLRGGAPAQNVFIAGFTGPYAIQLQLGIAESFVIVLVNTVFLLASIVLGGALIKEKAYALTLMLLMLTGINGLVLSRDLFNMFVFMELLSISTYALVAMPRNGQAFSAGFKYMIAGGLASTFFLIGTAFVYRTAGTLHLDYLLRSPELLHGGVGFAALFLVIAALLIELKPFPANGWALDVYQAGHPGVVSIITTAGTGAVLFVLYKLLPLMSVRMLQVLGGAGIVTFVFSNLVAIKQENPGRLLGYSSISQTGLVIAGMVFLRLFGIREIAVYAAVAGGLFLNHLFVKGLMFWLSERVGPRPIREWGVLAGKPLLLFLFGLAVVALSGLPPFPGFWAKWEFLKLLAANGYYPVLGFILAGSLIEVFYLFRWLGYAAVKEDHDTISPAPAVTLPMVAAAILLLAASVFFSGSLSVREPLLRLIPAAGILFYLLEPLPGRVKTVLALAASGSAAVIVLPGLSGLHLVFGIMLLGGSLVQMIAGLGSGGRRRGIYPGMVMMVYSFAGLLVTETALGFFFAWEMMTLASYLLILRGSRSARTPLLYMIFSTGGAFLILAGLITALPAGSLSSAGLGDLVFSGGTAFYLIIAGFLVKAGVVGVHLWLPGFYSEADHDVSPILSSALSKAAVAGLFIFMSLANGTVPGSDMFSVILGWIGGLTAFFGTLMAIYQEDAKRLLAFSSMGQMGYIILAASLMSTIGWTAAIYIAVTHLLFKGIMFLSVGGVVSRLNTTNMYEMGGMIKRMPLSFMTFLIGLIALSGVPPLTGFGGKWLLYSALVGKGWYMLTALALFSSAVAFLYCYRIIHSVFLGQLKTGFRAVKEASVWYLIPQFIFVMLIMIFSMVPRLLIEPISAAVGKLAGPDLLWQGNTVSHALGYWNGTTVMMVTMGVFMVPLVWLLSRVRSIQKVKQFNIVYAAERPDRPETTHYAHNFFAHYTKALGFLSLPLVRRFWEGAGEWISSIAAALRHLYSGNGQTYALQVMLYITVLYLFMR